MRVRTASRLAAAAPLLLALAACDGQRSAETPPAENAEPVGEAAALPELGGRVLAVGCRQGECAWLRVARLERVETNANGELRRLVGRGGISTYGYTEEAPTDADAVSDIAWDTDDKTSYAFCSTVRPSYAFADDSEGLIVHVLDLYNVAGYQYSSARLYMRICHDADFTWDDGEPLRQLGYRPGDGGEQIEGASTAAMTRF